MENSGNKQTLRLWLRWLNCTTRIENEIRQRLREQFQVTLPQFDLLSTLERTDEPMTMSELSQYLLVSNGNVTGVVRRLQEKGLLEMKHLHRDRRKMTVSLTKNGKTVFLEMAGEHQNWINSLMSGVHGQEEAFGETLKNIRSDLDNLNQTLAKEDS